MEENDFIRIHANVMARIQREWDENEEYHRKTQRTLHGIRSSQISALVAVFLKEPELFLHNVKIP